MPYPDKNNFVKNDINFAIKVYLSLLVISRVKKYLNKNQPLMFLLHLGMISALHLLITVTSIVIVKYSKGVRREANSI